MPNTMHFEIDSDRVMTVWLNLPHKSVNTLSVETWSDLDQLLESVDSLRPAGIVWASAKQRSFLAGADLFEMQAMDDASLDAYLSKGQRIVDRLAALPMPTVAAINGDALGGGLELALACRWRVAIDEPHIRIGLPESTLGLVPSWGGTIRLPRLVGLEVSLELMISGRPLSPAESLDKGMVDRIVPREQLLPASRQQILEPPPSSSSTAIAHNADAADYARIIAQWRARLGSDPAEEISASRCLVDIVELSYRKGHAAALEAERRGLIELRHSAASRHLMDLFFQRLAAKKTAANQASQK